MSIGVEEENAPDPVAGLSGLQSQSSRARYDMRKRLRLSASLEGGREDIIVVVDGAEPVSDVEEDVLQLTPHAEQREFGEELLDDSDE